MATIRTRKQSDGTSRYTAIIRIRKRKTIIYQEYKTFALRTAAVSLVKHREVELEKPGSLYRAQHGTPTRAELIRWYIDTFETISKWQRSKQTSAISRAPCDRQGQRVDAHFAHADRSRALPPRRRHRTRDRDERPGLDRGRVARGKEREGAACPY
jgi:hypothetical protein